MKIVKFKNGKFGIRKWSFGYGYRFWNFEFCEWESMNESTGDHLKQTSLENAQDTFDAMTDCGTPVERES